jgi:two-component system, chemotaxis family, chemotaxis protein CheY
MKTLIVEDDPTSRLLLHTMLRSYGECELAADGREALAALLQAEKNKKPFQLVCLDIMMPDIDGKEVLEALRGLERASGRLPETWTKVVMTTARDDVDTVSAAYYNLCDRYLVKPIDKAKLLKCLVELKLIDRKV